MDYYAETTDRGFLKAQWANLRQEGQDPDFPLISLNPRYSWHSGSTYWTRRLDKLIVRVEKETNGNYVEALKILSSSLAILELVPYHSKEFGLPKRKSMELSSTRAIRGYVHNCLGEKARAGEALIIVLRGKSHWNLPDGSKWILHGSANRSGSLPEGSHEKIFKFLESQSRL